MPPKLLATLVLICASATAAAQPADVQYVGHTSSPDLQLAECKDGVRYVVVQGRVADGGKVTLTLDPNGPKYNEFGDEVAAGKKSPVVSLECTLKLVKKEKDKQLYEIRGPKVVSKLFLVALPLDSPTGDGRLLVHGKDGEVRYKLDLIERTHRTIPCHPGCFPAGTTVRVPDGTQAIERVREGDLVTTIDADGKPAAAKVTGVFVTRNRVLEVRVKGATLVTTETQPVALERGGFRPASELKAGDKIWRWVDGKRAAAVVQSVTSAGQTAGVFNVVLGEPTAFVAGDFLVRSKPPAEVLP